jgi:hypothetical protein
MCDLHLAIYMILYVYVAYPDNVAAKSWLAPGCPWGASNRRCMSNRVSPISATVALDGN